MRMMKSAVTTAAHFSPCSLCRPLCAALTEVSQRTSVGGSRPRRFTVVCRQCEEVLPERARRMWLLLAGAPRRLSDGRGRKSKSGRINRA